MFRWKWSSTELLVAQDWIEETSKKSRFGRHCRCCPRVCYKRTCVEMLYLYCGALCCIAVILFLILACGIFAPFHRSRHFIPTTCTTISTKFEIDDQNCICSGHHCQSYYPCIHTRVYYNTTDGEYEEALLYNSQYEKGQCSYTPHCYKSKEKNKHKVIDFALHYGSPNASYTCLYNPDDLDHVIRIRDGTDHHMAHMLIWPAVVILISALGLLLPYLLCGCGFLWKKQPPTSIKQEAELRSRGIKLSEYSHMETNTEEGATSENGAVP